MTTNALIAAAFGNDVAQRLARIARQRGREEMPPPVPYDLSKPDPLCQDDDDERLDRERESWDRKERNRQYMEDVYA